MFSRHLLDVYRMLMFHLCPQRLYKDKLWYSNKIGLHYCRKIHFNKKYYDLKDTYVHFCLAGQENLLDVLHVDFKPISLGIEYCGVC